MKRALLVAGAVALLAAPAFAESSSVTIEKHTVTTSKTVPQSGSTVSTVVVAPSPPPPPRVEAPPGPPNPQMVWMQGHWSWNPDTRGYVWVHGKYAEPPHLHAAWVPGHWTKHPQGWVWESGHWD